MCLEWKVGSLEVDFRRFDKGKSVATRECPYCGKIVFDQLKQCAYCRETLPEVRRPKTNSSGRPPGKDNIHRGLLFMLAAAVLGYFASGSSPLTPPIQVPPIVANYLAPLLFLSGLGLSLHGLYLRHRTSS
jgi:hypothetical protein